MVLFPTKKLPSDKFIEATCSLPHRIYRTGVCYHVCSGVCFRVCWKRHFFSRLLSRLFLRLLGVCFRVCWQDHSLNFNGFSQFKPEACFVSQSSNRKHVPSILAKRGSCHRSLLSGSFLSLHAWGLFLQYGKNPATVQNNKKNSASFATS